MNATTCSPVLNNNFTPNRLIRLAETLFNEGRPTAAAWSPLADVSETDTAYVVKLDLPEVKTEDVKVSVRDGILTIRGERKYEKSTENEKLHLRERTVGAFSRSFSLPKDADAENVSAAYVNGTLAVTVLKRPEVQPKEIQIRVG